MGKPAPFVRSANGRDYECARKASHSAGENTAAPAVGYAGNGVIPDGCIVQGHWTSNVLDGVRVLRLPNNVVVHTCGVVTGLSAKWDGQVD